MRFQFALYLLWGNIILEANFVKSYNFGFLTNNSDILISLIHWQYWWWFWFSFLVSFYYLILLKYISTRLLKFNPKIVTSYRSHGKWGDVIICFLPVSWCVNILSNSTTLLKIIEWQSEASLITLRVRGKQWYWVYKIDIKSILNTFESDLNSVNIGSKKLFFNNNFTYNYSNLVSYNDNPIIKSNLYSNFKKNKNNLYFKINTFLLHKINLFYFIKNRNKTIFNYNTSLFKYKKMFYSFNTLIFNIKSNLSEQLNTLSNRDLIMYDYLNYNLSKYKIFYNKNFIKKNNNTKYFVLLQKSIADWSKIDNSNNFDIIDFENLTNINSYYSINKISNYNNSRLLKTDTILVLPTEIFINVITNSFDVIHSWFIPGLGFKMDCIPGRSTHHTLFIDIPGLYYGQCAEICGRLHHHMPIKVCAMSFEHFYLWWIHTFNSLLFLDSLKNNNKFSLI